MAAQDSSPRGEDSPRFMSVSTMDARRRYWRQYRRAKRAAAAPKKNKKAGTQVRKKPATRAREKPVASRSASAACPRAAACPRSSLARGVKRPAGEDERSRSRHRMYPCCGKRRSKCVCDFTSIEKRLRKLEWARFVHQLKSARLLTARDTADVGWFLSTYPWQPGKVSLRRFVFLLLGFPPIQSRVHLGAPSSMLPPRRPHGLRGRRCQVERFGEAE